MFEPIHKSPWADIGRGAVVAAPKTHPAWLANAVLNNPTAVATGGIAAAGGASQLPRFDRKRSPEKERAANVGAGAAIGAGAGVGADRAAFYTLKREYLKPENKAGQNGRAAKREIKRVKTEAAAKHPNNPRLAEHYKNANWPEGLKDAKLRRMAATHTGGKNAVVLAGAGAALGVGAALARNHHKKESVAKSMSPFGIDHGYEITKSRADESENLKSTGPATAGRHLTGYFAGGIHGAVAGRKGRKLRAAGTELGGEVGGILAGSAVDVATHGATRGLGRLAGGVGGNVAAVKHNQRVGNYKQQPKGSF